MSVYYYFAISEGRAGINFFSITVPPSFMEFVPPVFPCLLELLENQRLLEIKASMNTEYMALDFG